MSESFSRSQHGFALVCIVQTQQSTECCKCRRVDWLVKDSKVHWENALPRDVVVCACRCGADCGSKGHDKHRCMNDRSCFPSGTHFMCALRHKCSYLSLPSYLEVTVNACQDDRQIDQRVDKAWSMPKWATKKRTRVSTSDDSHQRAHNLLST